MSLRSELIENIEKLEAAMQNRQDVIESLNVFVAALGAAGDSEEALAALGQFQETLDRLLKEIPPPSEQ